MTLTLTVINGEVRAWFKPEITRFGYLHGFGWCTAQAKECFEKACEKAKAESIPFWTNGKETGWHHYYAGGECIITGPNQKSFRLKEGDDLPLPEGIEWELVPDRLKPCLFIDAGDACTSGDCTNEPCEFPNILRLRPVEKKPICSHKHQSVSMDGTFHCCACGAIDPDKLRAEDNELEMNHAVIDEFTSPVEPKTQDSQAELWDEVINKYGSDMSLKSSKELIEILIEKFTLNRNLK
jgi:hypothetical protein